MKTENITLKVTVKINYEEGYRETALGEIKAKLEETYFNWITCNAEVLNAWESAE